MGWRASFWVEIIPEVLDPKVIGIEAHVDVFVTSDDRDEAIREARKHLPGIDPDAWKLQNIESWPFEDDEPRYFRAAGDCICKLCGKKYIDHPTHEDLTFLHVLCDGRLVKL